MSDGVTSSQNSGPNSGTPGHTNNFKGGILVAVFALLLLLTTFSIPNPMIPRALTIALGVLGVVTAFGLIPVRAPQDYYGGIVLLMLATLALIASSDLPGQRGFAFGPGTAPRLFAICLIVLSIVVTAIGATTDGPPIEKYKLRGPLWVLAAIVVFATIIRPVGLIVTSFLTWLIAICGTTEMRWIESIIASAVMTVFCVLLFVYMLVLPFQLWPLPNAPMLVLQDVMEFFGMILGPILKFIGVA